MLITIILKGEKRMWGIGKQRSKLGKWMDKKGLDQQDLAEAAKVSKNTVSKACSEKDYIPRQDVMKKLLKAIREIDKGAKMSDFWDM
jgi:transcriptional regulator with XRE-family HTH domain